MSRPDWSDLTRRVKPEAWVGGLAALVAVTALAGFLYGVKPALAQYQELSRKHSDAEQEAAAQESARTAEAIRVTRERLEELRTELYGGPSAVPRRQIEAFVVDSLHQLSQQHTVQLMGVTPEEASRVLMFEELPYDVRVRGRYFDLHRWLHDVEAELRPMVVKRFALTPDRDRDAVTLELRLVAYRAPAVGVQR